MNTNFKVIGLTRIGIKSESTAPEADALITRPSELQIALCGISIIGDARLVFMQEINVFYT